MKIEKNVQILIISLIIVGALSFYGGMQYQKLSVSNKGGMNRQMGRVEMSPANNKGNMGGGFVSGQVKEKDENTLTVSMKNGGSKIILFSDKTQVLKSTAGSLEDIVAGTEVMISGSQNQDGSVSAQSIQLMNNKLGDQEEQPEQIPGEQLPK